MSSFLVVVFLFLTCEKINFKQFGMYFTDLPQNSNLKCSYNSIKKCYMKVLFFNKVLGNSKGGSVQSNI